MKANSNSSRCIVGLMKHALEESDIFMPKGRITGVVGTIIKAAVNGVRIGEICKLRNPWEGWEIKAEVVGFSQQDTLLIPLGTMEGLSSITEVVPTGKVLQVPVGPNLMGRILNGFGEPIDEGGPLSIEGYYPIHAEAPPPMKREIMTRCIPLGIRAIDGLLSCGEGQRIGIFAAAGVGKSTLLSSFARDADVDVTVLALIGERGKEVREFIEHHLGAEGLMKSVVIVSTSDRPAMERVKAAYAATAIAEYFRDQGKRVLLLMDSVTRFGRALREVGLAAGEMPTRRGFPPSVFASLPKLMERPGITSNGSITALYTVLVEGDDMTEPIADETRSILDGHIVLSRKLAESNHYPAIDVLASISRVMNQVVSKEHVGYAGTFRSLLAKYRDVELLIKVGEYKKGADSMADLAIEKNEQLNRFLRQEKGAKVPIDQIVLQLKALVG